MIQLIEVKLVFRAKLTKKDDVYGLFLIPQQLTRSMVGSRIIFSSVIAMVGSFYSHAQEKDKDGFVLVKQSGTTSVYERWITFPKSDPPIKAREVKGIFYYHNTIAAGMNLIQDERKIKEWQKHVSEFKAFPQSDTTSWLEYSYHDIPWPVSDQDHFLKYTIEEYTPGRIFVTFESRKNETLAPVRKGVTRMVLSGSWTWERISAYETKASYRILSMPIGIPKWLTDPIIRNNIMTTIEEYIALLEPSTSKAK